MSSPPLASAYLQWTDPQSGEPRFVRFDVIEGETHTQTAEVTEHAVEDGQNVTDHVRHNAEEVKLDVFISGSPLHNFSLTSSNERGGGLISPVPLPYPPLAPRRLPQGPAAIFQAFRQATGLEDGLLRADAVPVLNFPGGMPSVELTWNELRTIWQKSILVQVVTPLHLYEDMVLLSLETPRTAKEGDSLRSSATFKKIRRAKSRLVRAPAASIPRASKPEDKGKQDTTTSTGQQEQTVLKYLSDKAGGNPARRLLGR